MSDVFMYSTITSFDEEVKMTANWDEEKKLYYAICIDIGKNISWDNDKYIFNDFYPYLLRWKARRILESDDKEFSVIKDFMSEDFVDSTLEMIELAKIKFLS